MSIGLPEYANHEESDTFILERAEERVPALVQAGGQWVAPRNLNGRQDGAPIRPRVEDDFACIERWRNIDDPADSLWHSIPGDNVNRCHGRTCDG
jgi:hypothetical protein